MSSDSRWWKPTRREGEDRICGIDNDFETRRSCDLARFACGPFVKIERGCLPKTYGALTGDRGAADGEGDACSVRGFRALGEAEGGWLPVSLGMFGIAAGGSYEFLKVL